MEKDKNLKNKKPKTDKAISAYGHLLLGVLSVLVCPGDIKYNVKNKGFSKL